ncbi:MAG: polysaccharide biosynthesis/export family protein [Kiritimatiellia bacterium]
MKFPISLFARSAALLLLSAPFAAAQEAKTNAPAPLLKGDAILVRIDGIGGGLPEYREIVDSQGNVEVPFLGLISAAGKTPAALETEMAAAYATANLSANASVRITLVTHFEPPPDRSKLVRIQDPRRPAPAAELPPAAE